MGVADTTGNISSAHISGVSRTGGGHARLSAHPSANGRYMVDASNAPFLIIGDAPHSILANLNNSDAVTYLTDRGQRGFNALWIELLCDSYTFGYGNEGTAKLWTGRERQQSVYSRRWQAATTI